jgi:putative PIN family toxin of toxin-antitoxin system
MRVFLDTNVLVSAVATRGLCADVLREVLVSHQLVISSPLLNELTNILHSKFGIPFDVITEFIEILNQDVILSGQSESAVIDIQDQDDVIILSTALSGGAELFVTGDKEILALGKIQHMEIVSPRKFWEILRT